MKGQSSAIFLTKAKLKTYLDLKYDFYLLIIEMKFSSDALFFRH